MDLVRLAFVAATLESLFLALALLGDLRQHIVATLCILTAASILYLFSVYSIQGVSASRSARTTKLIAGAAILFRLTVWPSYPAFSDDVFRYRWEGMVQAHGYNPYMVRPNDAGLPRDAASSKVVTPDFPAAYGPLMELEQQAVYRAVAALTSDPFAQAFWFKLPSALCELGILFCVARLLAARGLPAVGLLLYAWCPAPIFEFWATGHNDAIPVLTVVAALWAASRDRWGWAFLSLSIGACAKVWPMLLFPAFIGWRQRRWQAIVLAPIAVVSALPYWSDVTNNARFLTGFIGGWRNNDSLFGLLLWLRGGNLLMAKYMAMTLIAALALGVAATRLSLEQKTLAVLAGTLLLSANCHPWYLTWLAPLLPFCAPAPLLLWFALMPLGYRVLPAWILLGEWNGSTPDRWFIFGPVFGLAAALGISKLVRHRS